MTMHAVNRGTPWNANQRANTIRRDYLADAERQDRTMNEESNTLERRIHALEALLGVGVAATLRQPAERAREAATETLYAYSAHIEQLEDDHRRKLEALQAEASDARVSLARALVLIRDLDDRIRGRRLKSFDDLTARALEFIADHQGPPF